MAKIITPMRGLVRPRPVSPLSGDGRVRQPLAKIFTHLWLSRSGVTNASGVSNWTTINSGISLTSTAKPTFVSADSENGKPAIQSNGTSNNMKLTANTIAVGANTDRTIVFVRRCRRDDGNFLFLWSGTGEGYMSSISTARQAVYNGAAFPIIGSGVGYPVSREIVCEIFRFKASTGLVEYWRDGTLYGTASTATAALSTFNFWLFANTSGAGGFSSNDLFAFGIEPKRAISDQEITDANYWVQAPAPYGEGYISRLPVATNRQKSKVMFFGDSMTAMGTNNDDGAGVNIAYREIIASRFPGCNYVGTITSGNWTHHEGVSGNTFVQMQARLSAALAANPNPDFMLVQGGTNDASGGLAIDTNMKAFIQAAYAISPGTHYLLIDPPPNANSTTNSRIVTYWGQIDAAISTLQGLGINITRVTAGSLLSTGDLGTDGTHLSFTGQLKWAHYIEDVIRPILT